MIIIDYIMDPLKEVVGIVSGIAPTALGVLAVLVIGSLLARFLGTGITRVLKRTDLDKVSQKTHVSDTLETGGIKRSISELVGAIVSWVLMVTTFVVAMKMIGVTVLDDATGYITGYLPGVMSGIVVLTVALVIAYMVSAFIRVVAANTGMPKPELLGMYSKWAIVTFAGMIFLEEIGLGSLLVGTPFQYLFGALCLALALSFGLGGRDAAARTIEKLRK